MMDAAAGDAGGPRAFLKVGAGTVARHQLALALAMDCTLIVCLAREMAPEVVELQHEAEKAGARFHAIAGPRALVPLITATDELIVVSDGLLAAPKVALPLLESGHVVLVQPVESGVAAGFERIDLNHSAAGLMRIPGRLVDRLAELEPDCDAISALTRAALQSGVAMRLLPPEARQGVRWSLICSEGEAGAVEAGWLGLHAISTGPLSPGTLLARLAVRLMGPAMLHAGSGGTMQAVASMITCAIALGLGWLGWTASALVIGAFSWVLVNFSGILRSVERESLCLAPDPWPRETILLWLHDAVLVAILVWNPQFPVWYHLAERGFAPLLLICLIRLLPRAFAGKWVAWIEDRALLMLLLAMATGFDVLNTVIPLIAASLGIIGILLPANKARLTRV